jgi:hypothetical protein
MVEPAELVRITRRPATEPWFGKSASNRFDDPAKVFGVCYLGFSLEVAFAETVLHDEVAEGGVFTIMEEELDRHIVDFEGDTLMMQDLTGAAGRRAGVDGRISTDIPYDVPQRWSSAFYAHSRKIDGLIYMSRNMNTGKAVALYDRAKSKLRLRTQTPLLRHPGAANLLMQFALQYK